MIDLEPYSNKTVLVMGYGITGSATATALRKSGANVLVWDDSYVKRRDAEKQKFKIFDENTDSLKNLETVIWSPGIPHTYPTTHPLAKRLLSSGHTLRCDIDLLAETQTDALFIGITGTNGKSTTTALTQHILQTAQKTVEIGGNFGIPALNLKPLINDGLNGYIGSKMKLLNNQTNSAIKIIVNNDTYTSQIIKESRTGTNDIVEISCDKTLESGISISNGVLIDTKWNTKEHIDLKHYESLPGKHNWLNAAAAYAVAKSVGISNHNISNAFSTFKGLKHRQELIGKTDVATFINDSKATNANATMCAMACYNNIYWIAGGVAKDEGIEPLKPLLHRVKHAFLIGKSSFEFSKTLDQEKIQYTICKHLEHATIHAEKHAEKDALPGSVILLSPACASFDAFKNFEERGDKFRQIIVNNWPEVTK
jgi:UDP-N-acetylmuramoylalanine--D-glutamate ligase